MKTKRIFIGASSLIALILFLVGPSSGWPEQAVAKPLLAQAATLSWNTFNGGAGTDNGRNLAVDGSGNVYLTGNSNVSWGSPIRPLESGYDVFVAKYNASGALQWNTFFGGGGLDNPVAIALDVSGNIYVTGSSASSWGSPVSAYSTGAPSFVAKLNSVGALQWNTFVGGTVGGIAVNGTGGVFLAGYSDASWGSPINPFNGSGFSDAYVVALTASGAFLWNTFLGGTYYDYENDIALDSLGNIYATGYSADSWGGPIRAFTPGNNMLAYDAFAAKFSSAGVRLWNTFLGGSLSEYGNGIAVDSAGNAYVAGTSASTWETPLRSFSALNDAFVAKVSTSGALQWNTFLGGTQLDTGIDIAVNPAGLVFVTGNSNASWGSPSFPFKGNQDTFATELNLDGSLNWNGFLGSSSNDWGSGIGISASGGLFVGGTCYVSWGAPIQPFGGISDAFLAKVTLDNSLFVSSPNGGETWGIDSVRNIAWATTGTIANVTIEYSSNNGANWTTIAASTPNDGVHPWTVLAPVTAIGLIRITDAANPLMTDTSNAVFSVSIGTPTIGLSKNTLNFGAIQNGTPPPAETSVLTNTGSGVLSWTAAPSADWLSVTPTSGTGAGVLTIGIARTNLGVGSYVGTITVTDPAATNTPQVIAVNYRVIEPGFDNPPFGSFDTPAEGANVASSIPVTGWVLDDIGMQSLKIYRGTNLSDRVFIGDGVFVEGARPDVAVAHPGYPQNTRAGWGYMLLTNFLPNNGNGTFTLLAYATDLSGHEVLLDRRTIICDNANAVRPFGAIDTPTQGGTALGTAFFNFGWALTPLPNIIPIDGSTLKVWIDGLPLAGHPTYNHYRADISNQFPGYLNAGGAVGLYTLDTTIYTNAVHTIEWSVVDSAGNADGIGSRYFSIQNIAPGATAKTSSAQDERIGPTAEGIAGMAEETRIPVYLRRGMAANTPAELIVPGTDGAIRITIPEVTRVAVYLQEKDAVETEEELIRRGVRIRDKNAPADDRFEAYELVWDRLKPLPIGASFDTRDGVLYWQPGPGFLGEYVFVLVDRQTATRKTINIKIK